MEAVPDIVQLPDDEAQHKEKQQENGAELVPQGNFLCGEEQKRQHHRANTAVQVGQALLEGRLQPAELISGHLPHGVQ